MKAPFRRAILVSLLLPLGSAAEPLDGALIYTGKTCATCHGQDGDTPTMTDYPRLAGQSADYAYIQMLDIKNGVRNNGKSEGMRPVMNVVSEAEMRAIADWLATLK
ncbi:c-type cytochrome [Thiocystis violacea]|uniref:c-type cytochrome n=1 Tax=Thiocystis violacea TaxID=13725 RepID=UPI001905EC42|nr:c-type cytochrome [Thiocystis violacea]MBK1718848.1 cytochrome C [Thiocystis violacea]